MELYRDTRVGRHGVVVLVVVVMAVVAVVAGFTLVRPMVAGCLNVGPIETAMLH